MRKWIVSPEKKKIDKNTHTIPTRKTKVSEKHARIL